MKLKYMLRGLGIGVTVTAAVMGAYSRNAVADARAAVIREYGLGEENRAIPETQEAGETGETGVMPVSEPVILRDEEIESQIHSVADAAKESEQAGRAESSAPEGSVQPEAAQVPASLDGVTAVEPERPDVPADGVVEIVISSGDDSGTVSRKLFNAGLIGNAAEYDAYLMQHGYDKRLNTGVKTIYAADSWQEIAEKLVR